MDIIYYVIRNSLGNDEMKTRTYVIILFRRHEVVIVKESPQLNECGWKVFNQPQKFTSLGLSDKLSLLLVRLKGLLILDNEV